MVNKFVDVLMAGGLEGFVTLVAMWLPFIRVPLPVNAGAVVNNARVSDHHALLPTEAVKGFDLQTLPTAERNIFSMVIIVMVALAAVCITVSIRFFRWE